MIHFVSYWPFLDAFGFGGPAIDVEAFWPDPWADLRACDQALKGLTAAFPQVPFVPGEQHKGCQGYHDAVLLPVVCQGPGFTFRELRQATVALRRTLGWGCYFDMSPQDWNLPLCGDPANASGMCDRHEVQRRTMESRMRQLIEHVPGWAASNRQEYHRIERLTAVFVEVFNREPYPFFREKIGQIMTTALQPGGTVTPIQMEFLLDRLQPRGGERVSHDPRDFRVSTVGWSSLPEWKRDRLSRYVGR